MKTSIVVPVYGRYEEFLPGCLLSLFQQTAGIEIIVVTNFHPEETIQDGKYPGKFVFIDSTSQPTLINKGFAQATGEYYLDMGVDDFLDITYIAKAEQFLDNHPEYDIFMPAYETFGLHQIIWREAGLGEHIKYHNAVFMGSVMRASLWKKLQGFAEDIPHDAFYDWEFWIRAYNAGAKSYVDEEPLYRYRLQADNTHDAFSQYGSLFMEYARNKGII